MQGIIVYYTTYGTTRDYAEALALKMGWKAVPYKKAGRSDVLGADIFVLASNIRAGRMKLRSWAKKHKAFLKRKKCIFLAVAAASPDNQAYFQETVKKNFEFLEPKEESIFGLGGRKILAEMNKKDKFLFKMLDKMIKDEKEKEEILRDVDNYDSTMLEPVIACLQELNKTYGEKI
jgi:menaquinone-dependent protoporphyrinogen IX oxidase